MKIIIIHIVLLIFVCSSFAFSLPVTVGLIEHKEGSLDDGYILFSPINSSYAYLIDKCGYQVHNWIGTYHPGLSVYLLPNGKLLRTGVDNYSPFYTGGGGGYIELADWGGNVEWSYKLSNQNECQHHDVKYMPNGNILAIVWENKTYDEVLEAGRDPKYIGVGLWSEKIQELRPIGKDSAEIVWEWNVWDHLVQDFDSTKKNFGIISDNPGLMDLKFPKGNNQAKLADWLHCNSIDYNADLDQILISCRYNAEIWIIDHSTTKAEAAGHTGGKSGKGGDILYRWGNPIAYNHGTVTDQKLFGQHDATWIPKGFPYENCIMIFNNLQGTKINRFSSVDVIEPPINENGSYRNILPFEPKEMVWSYSDPGKFYASNLSSAQQLKNGNVLICNGPDGIFMEIDKDKNTVWQYIVPIGLNGSIPQGNKPEMANGTFRCTFYPTNFPAFEGKDLTQKGIIENVNINSESCQLTISVDDNSKVDDFGFYPNPAHEYINIQTDQPDYRISILDLQGNLIIDLDNPHIINTKILNNGVYIVGIQTDNKTNFRKLIISK